MYIRVIYLFTLWYSAVHDIPCVFILLDKDGYRGSVAVVTARLDKLALDYVIVLCPAQVALAPLWYP